MTWPKLVRTPYLAVPIKGPTTGWTNGMAAWRRRVACFGSRLRLRGRVEYVKVGFVYVGDHHTCYRPAHCAQLRGQPGAVSDDQFIARQSINPGMATSGAHEQPPTDWTNRNVARRGQCGPLPWILAGDRKTEAQAREPYFENASGVVFSAADRLRGPYPRPVVGHALWGKGWAFTAGRSRAGAASADPRL